MKAIVWTQEGCPNCTIEIEKLKAEGHEVEIRDVSRIMADRDIDAMAQLHVQGEGLPVVKVGDEFRRPGNIQAPAKGAWA